MDKILDVFERVFGSKEGVKAYFAPGRVNLIGEHTDYNGGHVFPCALDIGTYAAVKLRDDRKIRMYSENIKEIGVIELDLDNTVYNKQHDWGNYPKGVIYELTNAGVNINKGMDIAFYGTIPNAAGLSSSASIELVTAEFINDIFSGGFDKIELVKIAKLTENEYIGVNCGIMDQFAIGAGKKDHAIFLDTNSLEYKYVKLELEGISIVISNTNKKRGLADSKYNQRRSECEEALAYLKKKKNINSLGELTPSEFEEIKGAIPDPVCLMRAKHAVYENQRTIDAVKALSDNDIEKFGKLMNQSHISLKDDYDVTGIELDTLVELAWKQPGVIGSRMTGAGFGGCTVSLVKDEWIDSFISVLKAKYTEAIGYEPSFYVVHVGDGPKRLF